MTSTTTGADGIFFGSSPHVSAFLDSTGRFNGHTAYILAAFKNYTDHRYSPWLNFDYLFWPWLGQSWSVGNDAVPVITTANYASTTVKTFNGGVLQFRRRSGAQSPQVNVPTALGSFVNGFEPYTNGADENPGNGATDDEITNGEHGETGAIAFGEELQRLLQLENNLPFADTDIGEGRTLAGHNTTMIVAASGLGSSQMEDLTGTTEPFKRCMEQIQRAHEIAQSEGKTIGFPGGTWQHNRNNSNSIPLYKSQMEAELRFEIDRMIRTSDTNIAGEFTGRGIYQPEPFRLFTWVMNPTQNEPNLGNADQRASGVYERFKRSADTYPYIVAAGGVSQALHFASGNLHHTGPSNIEIAKMFAMAAHETVFLGNSNYRPFEIVQLYRDGKIAKAIFNPIGEIEIDEARVRALTNFGFQWWTSANAEITAFTAAKTGPNEITFTHTNDIPAGAYLTAASNGTGYLPDENWRCQVRDTARDMGKGTNRYLIPGRWELIN